MKTHPLITLIGLLSLPWLAQAQQAPANSGAQPYPAGDLLQRAIPSATPIASDAQSAGQAGAAPASTQPDQATGSEPANILLNFQGAQLSDVLNYLSQAAGFVIVQDTPVTGTVNIISRQPLTPDEAVDLLNSVLVDKNYVALRSGRILKIVARADAQKRDLPVITGADPAQIPKKDNVVTQILPVRYADVSKLVDNLRPLLSDDASISSNDASNAIILTDSETNIRRIAEIIQALDTSISGVSTIRVFQLRYADAKSLADTLTQLFQSATASTSNNGRQGGQGGPGGFQGYGGYGGRGGGGGGGGGGGEAATQSAARDAASRVVAVSDEASNSVIVSAPDQFMSTITDIVTSLDTNISGVTETRIFALQHADATEMAGVLTTLYTDPTGQQQAQQRSGSNNNRGPFPMFVVGQPQNAGQQQSQRTLMEARVVVVADPRTNSVIVSCSHDTMEDVALTIGRLDSTDARKQHVRIYTLENADPDNVAAILRGMFSPNAADTSNQQAADVLTQRTATGASTDIVNTLNTNGNSGGGGGGGNGGGGIR